MQILRLYKAKKAPGSYKSLDPLNIEYTVGENNIGVLKIRNSFSGIEFLQF